MEEIFTPISTNVKPNYSSRQYNNNAVRTGNQLDFSKRTAPGSNSGYQNSDFNSNSNYNAFDLDNNSSASVKPAGNQGFSFGDSINAATGVANAYLGYQSLELSKDQFGFAKNSFNVNLANQAQLINNEMENRQRARLETGGAYGGDSAALQADLQAYLKPRQVSGAPI